MEQKTPSLSVTTAGADLTVTLYRPPRGGDVAPLFVFAHGAGAGQSHPFMTRVARALAARGVIVATFDFPYMQSGRRSPDRAPILETAFRSVIDHTARVTAPSRLFIGGKSMGGRIATHLAAAPDEWPATAPAVSGVVVFGYPLNPPGGPSRRSPDRVSHLARIDVPLMIVQGTRDSFGGPDDIRAAAPHAEVVTVPTGDHSLAVLKSSGMTQEQSDAAAIDRVVAFMTPRTADAA